MEGLPWSEQRNLSPTGRMGGERRWCSHGAAQNGQRTYCVFVGTHARVDRRKKVSSRTHTEWAKNVQRDVEN